jgi:glutamate synthase domain-containing protein 1
MLKCLHRKIAEHAIYSKEFQKAHRFISQVFLQQLSTYKGLLMPEDISRYTDLLDDDW